MKGVCADISPCQFPCSKLLCVNFLSPYPSVWISVSFMCCFIYFDRATGIWTGFCLDSSSSNTIEIFEGNTAKFCEGLSRNKPRLDGHNGAYFWDLIQKVELHGPLNSVGHKNSWDALDHMLLHSNQNLLSASRFFPFISMEGGDQCTHFFVHLEFWIGVSMYVPKGLESK